MITQTTSSPFIQFRNVAKTYRTGPVEVVAVHNITLNIDRGEFVAVMGASGSGKSTLMNILGCLDRPTSGSYLLDGIAVANLSRKGLARLRNKKLGFVFQSFNLLARTSALENVELPMFYSYPLVPLRVQRQRAIRALERVGLGDRYRHHPSELSGGQQQRTAIARALVNEPELILADEPTGNLDTRTSTEIMGFLQELNDSGTTVVMVTHEVDIAAYCKRNIVMRDGIVVSDSLNESRRIALRDQKPPPQQERKAASLPMTYSTIGVFDYIRTLLLRLSLTSLLALRALYRNKLRSTLTALGIIIGVASVVAMVAVGDGARVRIESQVAALGQNLLTVFAGSRRSTGVNSGSGSASTITLADTDAIRREIPDVKAVSPEDVSTAQAVSLGRNWSTTIAGESPDYLTIRNWAIASGAMFTDREVHSAAKVAVMGSKAAHELFGPVNPIGQTVRVKNIPFAIIGVLTSKGAGMGGQNQDDRIVIPYTTAMKRITGDKYLRSVNIQIISADRMAAAQQEITSMLRQRHRLGDRAEDDFNVLNQKEIADTVRSVSSVITLLLGAIGGMSLLVGGIGIMNIMLVSVTERTREVGIRNAVGGQTTDIMLQFLIEAITLSLLGGLIGVLVGFGASKMVAVVADFRAIVSSGSIILAFGVCFVVGVFFGFYPARKAAALDPIEALRYE